MTTTPSSNIPVVFIHVGTIPDYLLNAISKAASYGNKVFLVTNAVETVCDAEIVDVNRLNHDEEEFRSYYQHMSMSTYNFEFICIYRWFILKNFANTYNFKQFMYLDSDVYLYANTQEIIKNYDSFQYGYSLPDVQDNYYWAASACCSFWTTSAINQFCYRVKEYYTTDKISVLLEKWAYHTNNNIRGGVCDMTFFYLFTDEPGFLNLAKVHNGCSFDFHNAIPANYTQNEYAFTQGKLFRIPTKDINFKDGIPYCKNLVTGETVRFFALTEYAKLLVFSKKQSLFERLKYKLYRLKNS